MIRRPQEPGPRAAFERLCTAAARTDADALVFADWLTEQGSSMGEYITLSRTGHLKPAHKLWERDRLDWLGRIGPFLEPHKDEFVGGLPEFAWVARTATPELVLPHARATEWLLFRALRLDPLTRTTDQWTPLFTSPALRRFTRLEGLDGVHLAALAEKKSRVRSLEVTLNDERAFKHFEAFPRLSEVRVRGTRGSRVTIEAFLSMKKLTRVELANALSQLDWAFLESEHAAAELALYEWISSPDWDRDQRREKGLKLCFRGAPRFKSVEITLGGKFERALPQQLLQLGDVPFGPLQVTIVPARPFSEDEREVVRRSLGPRVASLEIR